jgi:putative transposase
MAYKFRLKPSKHQISSLENQLRAHCYLYNCALQQRRDAWKHHRATVSFAQQSRELPAIRREIDGRLSFVGSPLVRSPATRAFAVTNALIP